jgi:acetyl-CoA C-acetyltransferase
MKRSAFARDVDRIEGLLMAPPYAIPRLLQRNSLNHADIHLWEIHEAFAAQVLAHIKALESPEFIRDKARVTASFGAFPRDRMNPNGGSVALGHPLAQRTRDILSQAQLSTMPSGERTIVSICADGGQETGALIDMTGAPVASTRS